MSDDNSIENASAEGKAQIKCPDCECLAAETIRSRKVKGGKLRVTRKCSNCQREYSLTEDEAPAVSAPAKPNPTELRIVDEAQRGIKCPKCGGTKFKVFKTWAVGQSIRRRRGCIGCGHEFSTMESPALA